MIDRKEYAICFLLICLSVACALPADAYSDVIIDNGGPGTSFTGSWIVSSAPNPYGINSLNNIRSGATYKWHAGLPVTGAYEVYMWWTQTSSRSVKAPVTVTYNGGSKVTNVNQQLNGGKWNYIGAFQFDAAKGGDVTLSAPDPWPVNYSADAVKFVYAPDAETLPVATIDSAGPSPSPLKGAVTFSGHGSNALITGYSWRSSIDGQLSTSAVFSTAGLSGGTHTIYFKVKNDRETWSEEVRTTIEVQEHIYACLIYNYEDETARLTSTLKAMGAIQNGSMWTYRNSSLKKTFFIHVVKDMNGMVQALKTAGAHIIVTGHSNYGLGPVFGTSAEIKNQLITNIRYIDDDRILTLSSPWVGINIFEMRNSHAFPFWKPIFKDLTSAVMPYDFTDPKGNPPYNYTITYQVPGDPMHYKVETVSNGAVERFSSSHKPAWYSSDGSVPDPSNPDHQQYFITNNTPWSPSFESTGDWIDSRSGTGYYNEDYLYTPAGVGNDRAHWFFTVPQSGYYTVAAWWPYLVGATSAAPYVISHSGGEATAKVDQRTNSKRWNRLGEFYFDAGDYSVSLSDAVTSGNVIADAVKVYQADNPPEIVQANFWADTRSGLAPLDVTFTSNVTGNINSLSWNFGDGYGYKSMESDDITYTYTKPGTYSVSLTVSGPMGLNTLRKTGYIIVGSAVPRLQAEFSRDELPSGIGTIPLKIDFKDESSGDVASWFWDFGDGTTSTEKDPSHTYTKEGNYTIRLTVADSRGLTSTESKANFVRAVVFERVIDNVDYPKSHFGSKTIVFRKALDIPKEEMKFDRMMYDGCTSGIYYLDTYNRGIVFYSINNGDGRAFSLYLRAYLEGKNDQQIWEILQAYNPIYDYYNFNKLPSEQ